MHYIDMRRVYWAASLAYTDLPDDPLELFHDWLGAAVPAVYTEPNAMALASRPPHFQTTGRHVLLSYIQDGGFVFFTNYASLKGVDLAATPRAALVFWWPQLERQIRIEGTVERLSEAASDAYFSERPRGSQLGTWSSQQSAP